MLVTLATLLILTVIFELWDGGLRIPFTYDGDALSLGTYAQNIIEKGWIYQSDRLGAPFGADARDYPIGGDNLNWLGMRILAFGTDDWVLVNNLFFLLTFPAAAVSALLALRWLGVSRATAAVAAILFVFAPYHFIRGTQHMLLASYAVVPVGVVLAVRVWRGEGPFLGLREQPRRWLSTAGWLALCAVVGSSGTYYTVFLLLLIAIAALFGFARGLNRRPLVAAAVDGRSRRRRANTERGALPPVHARARDEPRHRAERGLRERRLRPALRTAAHTDSGSPTCALARALG